VLEDDGLDDVGDVLDRVERALHRLDDVLPARTSMASSSPLNSRASDPPVDGVALALERSIASRWGCTPFIDSSRSMSSTGLLGHPHEEVGLLASSGSGRPG
jgi:hypothetical protein